MFIIVSLQEVIYDIWDVSQFGGCSLQSCVTAVWRSRPATDPTAASFKADPAAVNWWRLFLFFQKTTMELLSDTRSETAADAVHVTAIDTKKGPQYCQGCPACCLSLCLFSNSSEIKPHWQTTYFEFNRVQLFHTIRLTSALKETNNHYLLSSPHHHY